ncbi:protein DENND6A-like isoform X1 [Biomphalaria glabrata]|uniref:Protein DENND6A-like isoform X1 n=1 Tax=Biomphalaria glabrata TaxID=6526 RepID=A0A9W3A9D1_BIOGL|nr:protein DENND6A-like isoform X1 [Biomphalaria glabrata]KAI8730947.1 protein DENND6B isoform X1 [Biomphalaria glabrata]KAI8782166.1 protein DENND6B isoform X1 [Biomphalaria glabrata]
MGDKTLETEDIPRSVINEDEPINKSLTMLPWDRFSNWIHCACVVTFDLELGQAMELIYPGHIKLTDKEKMNICYLSFPDSNSGCMGDTQFHFRIRQCPGRKPLVRAHSQYNRDCPVTLQLDDAHYYGFVYFRQTKDRSIRRGYFQKSVVLITKLPFIALFNQVISIIAPEYFDNGEPSLEAACHDIDQWPLPVPGDTLNLPIMGSVIQVRLSCRSDKLIGSVPPKYSQTHSIPAHSILPSIHEVDIYSSFLSILPHVQLLWELVLIGEPIVVMASSPTITCNTVQALVNMIAPLKFCSDFRPYFTIHDSEFREYTTKTQAPPPVILGVTNPFFAKTLQHWPHIIRIGEMGPLGSSPKLANKVKKAAALKTLDSNPGVYTRYKSFLTKDKAILKRLMKGSQLKRPVEAQNAILRRHLLELTHSFMIPLERYITSLMPLQRNISPHKGPPKLRPFETEKFIETLEQSGPQLTSGIKGDWEALYRRFFRSPNFEGWYYQRQKEVNQKLQLLHLEALSNANLSEWIADKEEVQIIDLILKIKDKLNFATHNHGLVGKESVSRLQKQLEDIVSTLPDDLQSVIKT